MNKKQRIIVYATLAYLILAFVWWTFLLKDKNQQAYDAKVDSLTTRLALNQELEYSGALENHPDFLAIEQKYRRENQMILGEATMIALSIILVLYLALRSFRGQIQAAEQQRNFLLSITHELKSPIAGIRLILETFQRRRELPEGVQQRLSTNALTETDRLTNLVNHLLLSAKLETRYQLNPELIDLGLLVEESVETVALKYTGAKFHFDVEPNLPQIQGDKMGLTSVFLNLIENAAKYSQPNPVIGVTVRLGSSKEIICSISDNGLGIPDELKGKVWDRFYRIGSEDTRETKGTGLGLYIVKQLVERHQGAIEIQDNDPKGSTFVLSLPVF